jgi:hemerythrin superfamily protein
MKNSPSSPRSSNGSALAHASRPPRKRGVGTGGRAAPRRVPMPRTPVQARTAPRRPADDALAVLAADHAHIADLFARLARLRSAGPQKAQLASRLYEELELHTRIEEELLYPSMRVSLGAASVAEPIGAHASAREMVADLRALAPGDPAFDETLATLREAMTQHMREEEEALFPRVRALGLDLAALGRALKTRRRQLRGEPAEPALAGLATFPGMIVT